MDMLLLPAVNYSSRLSPPPFPSAISPQSWYSRPLKSSYFEVYTDTKYVWYNSFSFHAATKPFHAKITQNITLCTVHTQKVRNVYDYCEVLLFFSTKQHIYIHHNINISATGSTHLKSGPTLKEKLTGGVNWVYHFGKRAFHANYENVHSTYIKRTKQSNIEKQQTRITTSICSLLETLT